MIHELKTWPGYFQPIMDGLKTFEIRKADRDFAVGDVLYLREFDPESEAYTGRDIRVTVTYIISGGPFRVDGHVVMAFHALPPSQEHPDTASMHPHDVECMSKLGSACDCRYAARTAPEAQR